MIKFKIHLFPTVTKRDIHNEIKNHLLFSEMLYGGGLLKIITYFLKCCMVANWWIVWKFSDICMVEFSRRKHLGEMQWCLANGVALEERVQT